MIKQKIYIIDFDELFNILDEIKSVLSFQTFNFNNLDIFLKSLNQNESEPENFLIVTKKQNENKFKSTAIDKNSLFFLEDLPSELSKIIEKINIQLIKKKYNYQSKINIENYILNLNSRTIVKNNKQLKLTEKEIDIILFLNNNTNPQSVAKLQNEVWGYSSELETHTVETHIYRLRRKINNIFNDDKFIVSYDKGYLIEKK
jgi:DNA-binding response OmpR family regulator|tara:strand:- start:752 stop:1357 length:606 start_codon:yes stop_codon:yes gene_type:complete